MQARDLFPCHDRPGRAVVLCPARTPQPYLKGEVVEGGCDLGGAAGKDFAGERCSRIVAVGSP